MIGSTVYWRSLTLALPIRGNVAFGAILTNGSDGGTSFPDLSPLNVDRKRNSGWRSPPVNDVCLLASGENEKELVDWNVEGGAPREHLSCQEPFK